MSKQTIINESNLSSVPTKELGDEFISELNKLSMQERDEVTHDVHGINSVSEEDPEFISRSLESFESELRIIPEIDKGAYLKAREKNSDYVMGKKFVLMFLRADQFDTKASAARVVAFFQIKLNLFGEDKLDRDIRLDDLDEDDVTCLESGYAQVLNSRDRAGRAIFMLMPMLRKIKSLENRCRAIYMVLMHALKDEETQKNGIILIAYNVGRGKSTDRTAILKTGQTFFSIPARMTGVHYCYDDEKLRPLFYIAMFAVQKAARLRARFHLGTDMEIIYNLMTFGIPNEALPVNFNGTLRLEAHRDYVRRIRNADAVNDDVERIHVPGKYDVLLGRGKPLQKYSGNLNYHYVIETYHERYEAAAKGVKAELAMEIVMRIKNQGGRFLKQDEVGWTVITDEAAKTKVSHTFRNHRIAARRVRKKAIAKAEAADIVGGNIVPIQFPRFLTPTNIEHKKKKFTEES